MEIIEYKPEYIEALKDMLAELQDAMKLIEPEVIASGESVRDSYTEALLKDVTTMDGKIYMARNEDKFVGVVSCYIEKDDDEDVTYLYISDLLVTKSEQGKGIGTHLLEKCDAYARSKNIQYVRVSTLALNEGGHRLYQRSGFKDYLITLQKKLE